MKGSIDQHILNLHHVLDLPVHMPAYDWLLLAVAGVLFLSAGRLLMRSDRPAGGR